MNFRNLNCFLKYLNKNQNWKRINGAPGRLRPMASTQWTVQSVAPGRPKGHVSVSRSAQPIAKTGLGRPESVARRGTRPQWSPHSVRARWCNDQWHLGRHGVAATTAQHEAATGITPDKEGGSGAHPRDRASVRRCRCGGSMAVDVEGPVEWTRCSSRCIVSCTEPWGCFLA
jgi:hypothetical protein